MNSNIFNAMGIGGIDPAVLFIALLAVIVILLIVVIVMLVKTSKLKARVDKLTKGKDGSSLENILTRNIAELSDLQDSDKAQNELLDVIEGKLKHSVMKVGLSKYDAFQEMGGKLSFSLAMLDERDNGFVMSGIHSREGYYTYVKEVIDGMSDVAITEEEKKAMDKALAN